MASSQQGAPAAEDGCVRTGPLTAAQELLWSVDRAAFGAALNIATAAALEGELDAGAFEAAFHAVIARHEPLRTRYRLDGEEPRAEVLPPLRTGFHHHDLSRLGPEATSTALGALVRHHCVRPFDLDAGRPIRAGLIRLGRHHWAWLLGIHHIGVDAWSMMVLVRDLAAAYRNLVAGGDGSLPPPAAQCIDCAAWQQEWLQGTEATVQLEWWRGVLGDPPVAPVPLPVAADLPPSNRVPMAMQIQRLPRDLVERLHAVLGRARTSVFMVLLAAYATLVSRWCNVEEVPVGTLMANRMHPASGDVLGAHYNTVLLRLGLGGDLTVAELLERVRLTCFAAYERQGVPFDRVAASLTQQDEAAPHALLRFMFMHDEHPLARLRLPGVRVSDLDWHPGALGAALEPPSREARVRRNLMASNSELVVHAREQLDGLEIWIFYKMDVISDATARWFLTGYQQLVEALVCELEL